MKIPAATQLTWLQNYKWNRDIFSEAHSIRPDNELIEQLITVYFLDKELYLVGY